MKYRHFVEYGVTVVVPYFDGQDRLYLAVRIGAGACWRKAKRMIRIGINCALGCSVPTSYVERLLQGQCREAQRVQAVAPRMTGAELDRFCIEMMEAEECI